MYMERATAIAEPRAPVDHGVQIRFITESTDSTQSASLRRVGRRPAKDSRASSYGVAVRVQGIAGQPFVVLNSGEKGTDSFGVQIKGNGSRGAPDSLSSDSELPENPYGSPRRFVGSYSQGSTSDEELGTGQKDKLQRSHSHASLLNSAPVGPRVLTGSLLELTPSIGSSGNAIDTAPLSSVDSLICKFDRQGAQTRGRSGCRGRILSPDRRKRSQSLDSRVPRNMAEEREREQEHERDFSNASSPNSKQICTISGLNQGQAPSNAVSKSRQTQEWVFQSFEEPRGRTQDPGLMQFKSTPDLLRDQQEATTPGSADHAKTTIYNILREGSLESEASVKRKVSLVLEQMQALMQGSPSSVSQAMAVHRGLIQKIEELQQKLDEEMKKRQKLELTHEPSRLVLERQLEEKVEECMRLQEKLEKKKAEMQRSTQEFQDMKLLLDQGERLRHGLEDQLKEMQDRLRQGQNPDAAKETLLKAKAMAEAEVTMMGQRRAAVEATLRETQEENDEFRRRILGLEQQLKEARSLAEGGEAVEARLRDKVQRLEAERQRLEKALNASQEEEESLAGAKRMLEGQLEEAQRNLIRFGQEQKILNRALEEEGKQREVLRRNKAELEDQKRLLDKTVEKLNKEMEKIGEESQRALGELQAQLEEYKEKARRDVAGAQRQAKEWASEAEKAAGGLGQLQEEAQRLRQALQALQAERDTALLDKDLLAQKLQGLEKETESKKRSQDDKIRQLKNLEEKVSRLEAELDEERNTVELLTDRVNRARDQIDQLRAELLQERSSRQDLECDKISLERQNKDLKSRLASLEGFQKPSASLSQLEFQNQELQDRLQTEEREKTLLQTTNRKLERRVKELSIQIDDERQHVNDQKDQLSLRVKALKRQVDEAEEEIERLDSLRKKAQRELEEQHEVNEQLQARIKTLEKDSRRKATRSAAEASLKHDGLSSDEEFDSIYDPSSIASLLTESNLQTSSC
ncbi:cingulin isoform X4 [Monodelphis domestica]|uniref:cingulin isoform X4 n=1 Tax=Monodelphis domestica TaxID=13616 RepID=UPI0024E198BB|nr:cingulin isoform X4 [Monodelphis domestica]